MSGRNLWLLLAAVAAAGCAPSDFLARQFVRAPKTFPQVMSPPPRVYYTFPRRALTTFPLQLATVGDPPVTLAYRLAPPADYQTRMVTTQYSVGDRARPLFEYRAQFPGTPTRFSDHPRGTVVLLHGYGLDQDSQLPSALYLAQRGWRCVLVDLRGHGESSGDHIYFGLQEADDLSALMTELERRGQASDRFSVVGVSYGAAVALRWATVDPRVQAVVAITPYARLSEAVEGLRRNFAAWLPEGLIRRAAEKIPTLLGAPANGLDPIGWLEAKSVSGLFVAATEDSVSPLVSVEELATAARSGPALRLPEASHEEAPFRLEPLLGTISDWLEAQVQGSAGASTPRSFSE